MRSRLWGPVVVLVLCNAAIFVGVGTHGTSPLRTLLIVSFLAIAPGLAFVGPLRLSDPWLEVALVPALSLSIDAIVGGVLSYTGLWSPSAAILILVGLSGVGAFGPGLLPRARRAR